jgi:pantetheine-phosphate adenylyltransferase
VEVTSYTGLTVELCRRTGARFLIRGLRNSADFIAEQEMAAANHRLCPEVETVFLPASPEWAAVSSSLVRELWSFGADYTPYLSYPLPDIQQQ